MNVLDGFARKSIALVIVRTLRDAGILIGEPVVLNDAVKLIEKTLREHNPLKDPS